MSPELRSLVWKEWRERKWALALGTAWIVCGVIYAVAYELALGYRAPVGSLYSISMFFGVFTALFLSMRTSVGEVTQRTLAFSSSLPVSLRRQGAVRLAGAALTVVAPIVLGGVLLSIALLSGLVEQVPPRSPRSLGIILPNMLERESLSGLGAASLGWKISAVAAASSVQLLMILAIVGTRCRAEAQVGFIGAVIAFIWILGTGARLMLGDSRDAFWMNWLAVLLPQSLVLSLGYGDERGSYSDLDLAGKFWPALALNLIVLAALAAWFTRRYGAREHFEARSRRAQRGSHGPALLSRLPLRWPGRIAALVWLDLRQAVPLAVAGLALACVKTLADIGLPRSLDLSYAARIAGDLPGGTWIVGLLWGAVVGAGVFGSELQPGLGHFWRSRPISPSLWFWVKFVVGLLAVVLVLDGVTAVVSWNSPFGYRNDRISRAYLACFPLLHALTYSLAVLMVCLLRRTAWAAMSTVLLFSLAMIMLDSVPFLRQFEPIMVYNDLLRAERQGALDLTAHNYPLVCGVTAAITLAAGILAWRAGVRASTSQTWAAASAQR